MFAMELVVFLERSYGVTIIGADLKLDNFRTVQAMTKLVLRIQDSADMARHA
jgi:methoxymalonate biosynthesis acyl carrier protein